MGSEFIATTSVFLSQVQQLGRLPVPQWYVLVASLQGESDCSKGQSSLFIPLAQNLLLDVLVEQETGKHLWVLSCKDSKTYTEIVMGEQAWSSSVGLLEPLSRLVWGKLTKLTLPQYPPFIQ